MGFLSLTRFCNILLLDRQLAGWRLSATVWAVFIGLTACGLRTPVTSAGHGLEASTTNIATAQSAGLENRESKIKRELLANTMP